MQQYAITCCSTADMPNEYFQEKSIQYVCFHFSIDGKQYQDDLGKSMPYKEFYEKISTGSQATTSQVNVQEFIEFFEPLLIAGKDILHVSLSSGLSGAYNSANIAKNDLLNKYPNRKIEIVDSLGASSGYGLLIEMLTDMRDNGASYEEVHKWAENNKLLIHHWFFSTDLTSYIKGGRISKTAGLFGTILGICPLLNMDDKGHLIPREKIRSKKKVIYEIVEKMKVNAQNGLNYSGKCFISHSACLNDARAVADLIEATFKNLNGKVMINSVGTVIGSHTGPGTVALFFIGGKR
ncbi:DegV family protein [Sedimentibacter sp. zth1]|uniref:DegV family protein n=1 Tax=Sedimentibacter sp. zth1 TaxID=2816908 RepID=UPI001A939058|nr:DegV family protein [Sedimentibacter sp. zth1]QSX06503.1 DegV family protein [Sedimentibacter sp. zth1]